MLGPRVPVALKVFLTAVAIVDDMGAVAIIALAYTDALDWGALAPAAGVLAALAALNRAGVRKLWPYPARLRGAVVAGAAVGRPRDGGGRARRGMRAGDALAGRARRRASRRCTGWSMR